MSLGGEPLGTRCAVPGLRAWCFWRAGEYFDLSHGQVPAGGEFGDGELPLGVVDGCDGARRWLRS